MSPLLTDLVYAWFEPIAAGDMIKAKNGQGVKKGF